MAGIIDIFPTRDDIPDLEGWSAIVNRSNPIVVSQWTPDGTHIVFSSGAAISVVRTDGSDLWRLSESEHRGGIDHSPSISPDGTRIAYATSRLERSDFPRNFEIETSALDGSDKLRLTENAYMDTSPVWSPDGSRIALLVQIYPDVVDGAFYTMAPDASDTRLVLAAESIEVQGLPDGYDVLRPNLRTGPVWSPDGGKLAFIASAELRKLDESWGRLINILYAVATDGSGLTQLFPRTPLIQLSISHPSWSPDGSEILFGVAVIAADGSAIRSLPWSGKHAAWSPDGSRIAVLDPGKREADAPYLFTMARDGTDVQVLVRVGKDGLKAAR